MDLRSFNQRLDAIARRVSRPRNPATLTTGEQRARLCDLLGIAPSELAELWCECTAAGFSVSDFLRAHYA